jgi:pyrimidine deaminase RibD-like protein
VPVANTFGKLSPIDVMTAFDDPHYVFARLAVDKAKLCPVSLTTGNPAPRVAIVIARAGSLLGWAAKGVGGECASGDTFDVLPTEHAESALLARLSNEDLSTATAYVTLEPCTRRRKGDPCADQIIARGIKEVFIGNSDPNPDIGALAWRKFLGSGVAVRDFPPELRNEARRDNFRFFDKFVLSHREVGSASFDYTVNGGARELGPPGRSFVTKWTPHGHNGIWALDYQWKVSIAKNCSTFEDIDDPGRWFEDCYYTKAVYAGQIVIFRNDFGFAIIRILRVVSPSKETNAELSFEYVLRYRND